MLFNRHPSSSYAELHCLSNFSFLRGASHPEELVLEAIRQGYQALAITDECSLAGVVRAHLAARSTALKLLLGTELQLADGMRVVLIATDRASYGRLSALITLGRRRGAKGTYQLASSDLNDGLRGCLALYLPGREPDNEAALWLKARFPERAWVAVELHAGADDATRLKRLNELAVTTGLPLVATGDVHMHVRERRALQDTLTAIRLRTSIAEAGEALFPNGERHLRPLAELAQIYPASLLQESVLIAERCEFSLDELRYEYPEEIVPPGSTPAEHLRELTEQGLRMRYPQGTPRKVRQQIEYELNLIHELRYEHYFLTVHDIVAHARSQRILCQGRGSAANSVVCYALGITEVDPSRTSVLFERFISKERNEPPDIDVDFEHERREEVIQYIYRKYGRERAALTASVITYRPRSAIRDVGKALGFDLAQVDRLAKTIYWWDNGDELAQRLAECGFDADNPKLRLLMQLVGTLLSFPRHLSQHTGGFVISRGPLAELVPVENAAMPERTVIQWDKDDLDALHLLKVDVLALGMLTAVRRALDLVSRWNGKPLALADIPDNDAQVFDMLGRADTVGVFQIESRAQMVMLPRLRPRNYYDLVIEVAIVRPGPIQGGMVHPYLRRRQGKEPIEYPSEAVREVLERTLGVPIFQEQVMQLAMVAAGFSAGEADQLRRSMAAWRRRGDLMQFETRLFAGMKERGYSEEFAQRIFKQIQGFGSYGFPESHAASFALLAYDSAWLKYHYPAAFTCALLNSQPMGFYQPAQLIYDARRHGVKVLSADVNYSDWDCTLEKTARAEAALRLGLRMVSGMSKQGAQAIVAARNQVAFTSIDDAVKRSCLNAKDRRALAQANAFGSLVEARRQALWQVAGSEYRADFSDHAPRDEIQPQLPALSEGQNIVLDYASLGFSMGQHPLRLLRQQLHRYLRATDLNHIAHNSLVRVAGIVVGRQRPGTASGVIFVTLEDETGVVNIVVWNATASEQRRALLNSRLLGVVGKVERADDVIHVIAGRLVDLTRYLGRLSTQSRDFH